MKKRFASSRSAASVAKRRPSTARRVRGAERAVITAAAFDRIADLPVDDPAGDLGAHLDVSRARRPGREVQRVNVDFPIDLLQAIDREAQRIGVNRQAFIKLRLADALAAKAS